MAAGGRERERQKENTRKDENKYLEELSYTAVHRFIVCSYILRQY